jgi:hyperosmotically inducible periplasmic protein
MLSVFTNSLQIFISRFGWLPRSNQLEDKAMNRMLNVMAALLLGAGLAGASAPSASAPQSDSQVSKRVLHEIRMYPYYTMWDNLKFSVNNGNVELSGQVTEPFKKSDIARDVQKVPGVTSVSNNIEVLPLSPNDNRLRIQIARAIFRDPVLSRYSLGAVPSIHIIVDNGHVTLEGVVMNEMDKNIAGVRASSAGLSFGAITNNLQVEHPATKS